MSPYIGSVMKLLSAPFVAGLCAAVLLPAPAYAQQPPTPPGEQSPPSEPAPAEERRPFRGIFGVPDLDPRHSLVFSGSVFGAYDDNIAAALTQGSGQRSGNNRRLQQSGGYGAAFGGLNYNVALGGPRFSFGANAGAQLRYFRFDGESTVLPYYHDAATAGMHFSLSRSTRLSATQTFAYSRNYRFHVFPVFGDTTDDTIEDFVDADPDLDLFERSVFRHLTSVSLSHHFGRNTSGSIGYGFRYADFLDSEDDDAAVRAARQHRDYSNHSIFGRFEHRRPLTTHATLHLGYGLRLSDGRAGSGEPRNVHHINAGVSYSRALSFSRRTSLHFASGSTYVASERLSDPNVDPRSRFRITGNASLVHELGRTWTASALYRRGLIFREGFEEPFSSDSASARIAGLVTRRLSFSAQGSWALSKLQRGGRTGHRAFAGSANSTYALSQYFALFAQYIYYDYTFEEDVPLDPLFPRALTRQGVRAGITTTIPIF